MGAPTFRPLYASVAALVAALASSMAAAGPITTNNALAIHEGEWIFRSQVIRLEASDDPSPRDRRLKVWAMPQVIVHGVTPKLALFGVIPYLDKELQVNTPMGGRHTRGDSGLGDASVFARYTVWKRDTQAETLRFAPFLGVEMPTGDDDETDVLGKLPQPLQLGSGSWDPFGGVILTWQKLDWELDVSARYQYNSKANKFQFGDEARLDLSYQYRLWPRKLSKGTPNFLYGVAETSFLWKDENRIHGRSDENSGGFTWYLTPGLQYVAKRWVVETAVQIPVVQDLNGTTLEEDFNVRFGFRINF